MPALGRLCGKDYCEFKATRELPSETLRKKKKELIPWLWRYTHVHICTLAKVPETDQNISSALQKKINKRRLNR